MVLVPGLAASRAFAEGRPPVGVSPYGAAAGAFLAILAPVVPFITCPAANKTFAAVPLVSLRSRRAAAGAPPAVVAQIVVVVAGLAADRAPTASPFVEPEYAEDVHWSFLRSRFAFFVFLYFQLYDCHNLPKKLSFRFPWRTISYTWLSSWAGTYHPRTCRTICMPFT